MTQVPKSELWNALDVAGLKGRFTGTASKYGLTDRKSLSILDSFAGELLDSGYLRPAQTIEEFVLGERQKLYGSDDPGTLQTVLLLARILTRLGNPIRANELLKILYDSFNRAFVKSGHGKVQLAMKILGLTSTGKALPAVFGGSGAVTKNLDLLPKDLGSNLLAAQAETAWKLHGAGQTDAARRILNSVLNTAPGLLGRNRTTLRNALYKNSRVPDLKAGRRLQDALSFNAAQILGPNEPDTGFAFGNIVSSLRDFGAVHAMPAEVETYHSIQPKTKKQDIPTPNRDRFVNVWLSSPGKKAVDKQLALEPSHDYLLCLTIGQKLAMSAVKDPVPVPVNKLPPDPDGHWLEIVTVSSDFTVEKTRHHVFLPSEGEAFACSCTPGQRHTCVTSDRSFLLLVPVATPAVELVQQGARRREKRRTAYLRIALYFEKNLVQSLRLKARIAKASLTAQRSGYSVRIDYSLTSSLVDVGFLPPRTLNILTNDNGDESHKMVFNGDEKDPVSFDIDGHKVGPAITAARTKLRETGVRPYGGALGAKVQYQNLYNQDNGKSKNDFLQDLKMMADFGYLLWSTLFAGRQQDRQAIRAHLASSSIRPAVVQISRVEHSEFMFPWAMIYDIPLERSADHALCKCLDNWGKANTSMEYCPFEQDPGRVNVICPFGFWGFRHIIELPPSMPRGRALPVVISKRDSAQKPDVVMGISQELDKKTTEKHTQALETLATFDLLPSESLKDFKKALNQDQLEFVYLYCHGRRDELPGSSAGIPLLAVGAENEVIIPPDIITWQDSAWSSDHWKRTSPLVFINGCHTAELTPELLVNFVDTFIEAFASGVIGTEIMLLQSAAGEAAEKILARLNTRDGRGTYGSVGEAVREMRLHFLNKGSLLGLAYTPYCCADLKLAN